MTIRLNKSYGSIEAEERELVEKILELFQNL